MQQVELRGKLEIATIKWLVYSRRKDMLFNCYSPADIKRLIWGIMKLRFTDEEDEARFLKGIKLCNFEAMYDWLCEARGHAYTSKNFALHLLRSL